MDLDHLQHLEDHQVLVPHQHLEVHLPSEQLNPHQDLVPVQLLDQVSVVLLDQLLDRIRLRDKRPRHPLERPLMHRLLEALHKTRVQVEQVLDRWLNKVPPVLDLLDQPLVEAVAPLEVQAVLFLHGVKCCIDRESKIPRYLKLLYKCFENFELSTFYI